MWRSAGELALEATMSLTEPSRSQVPNNSKIVGQISMSLESVDGSECDVLRLSSSARCQVGGTRRTRGDHKVQKTSRAESGPIHNGTHLLKRL